MKRICVVLGLLLVFCSVVQAGEKCPCPTNYIRLAKYECDDARVCVLAEGEEVVTWEGYTWTALEGVDIDKVMVKAGQYCEEQWNPIEEIEGHTVSHVNFCQYDGPTAVRLSGFTARWVWLPVWTWWWPY